MPTRSFGNKLAWVVAVATALSACSDAADINSPVGPALMGVEEADFGALACPAYATPSQAAGEVHEFGTFALFVPAEVEFPKAVILSLGGPDTRAFVTGRSFGAPNPVSEAALQGLGDQLRNLALNCGVAILGKSRTVLPNTPVSDSILNAALDTAASVSGRSALSRAPLLVYGLSGGGPLSAGYVSRNPERVAGTVLRVPSGASLLSGAALDVPTLLVQAELDVLVNNGATTAIFAANRAAGGLWARAEVPGAAHFSISDLQREVMVNWMYETLSRRLLPYNTHTLRTIKEHQGGWLGDRTLLEVSTWGGYPGDRSTASWLPSRAAAFDWLSLVSPPTP